jgi:thioesterase domain-containing protein
MQLFVSDVTAADSKADRLGWDEFHQGTLTVHRLRGDHLAMLEPPEVQHLAHTMLESLHQARAAIRA